MCGSGKSGRVNWKRILLLACTFAPSPLRLLIWRMLGFRVGRGCQVSACSLIVADQIELGPGAVIGPFTLIFAPSRLRMGERSRIASFVRIIGHGVAELDQQTFVALGCLIDVTRGYKFHLGARSQIGPRGTYYTHGATGLIFNKNYPFRRGSIEIGEDTWIGMGCLMYPRVKVGSGCVVFPGSVVSGDLNAGMALVPAQRTNAIQTSMISAGLEDPAETKLSVMKEFLDLLAERETGSRFEAVNSGKVLHFPDGSRVILAVDSESLGDCRDAVVWSLGRRESHGTTCFAFEELQVLGPWTPRVESIATFLATECGTHFVFDSEAPRTKVPVEAEDHSGSGIAGRAP